MLRPIGNGLALVALIFICGLHLAVLQSVASVRMVMDYSQSATFSEGLNKTLNGAHPCAMCLKIRKTQGDENKKSEAVGYSQKKSEAAILLTLAQVPVPLRSQSDYADFVEKAGSRTLEPALRPPRSADV
jgi:hypothetical protein